MPKLGEALMEIGDFEAASVGLGLAVEQATLLGETRIWADALVTWHLMRRFLSDDLEAWGKDVIREVADVIPRLEALSAHDELAKAFRLLGLVHASSLRWSQQLDSHRQALDHARLAGDTRLEARVTAEYTACLRDGPTPAPDAVKECEAALERSLEDRQATAFMFCSLARLHAMQGDSTRARELILNAERMREDLGAKVFVPLTSLQSCRVETLAGDLPAAEHDLRRDFAKLSAMGERFALPSSRLCSRMSCASRVGSRRRSSCIRRPTRLPTRTTWRRRSSSVLVLRDYWRREAT